MVSAAGGGGIGVLEVLADGAVAAFDFASISALSFSNFLSFTSFFILLKFSVVNSFSENRKSNSASSSATVNSSWCLRGSANFLDSEAPVCPGASLLT